MHIRRSLLWIVCSSLLLLSPNFAQSAVPSVEAQSAILMSAATGQILYEKKPFDRSAPASTTKILTAIIAIESNRLDDVVKVSSRAAYTPGSSMHLYPEQLITLNELVTGLLLRSGNDAAVAIAEHLAGSVDNFIVIMNQKADLLGAKNSQFKNPHGLTAPGHYSSAYDLAIMARYALANPIFAQIVGTKQTSIEWLERSGKEREVNLRNTNKLLWMFEDADGVKTGTTGEAGPCLVSSASRDNHQLIAVVLKDRARWYDSLKLLKYGFEEFQVHHYAAKNDVVEIVPVDRGIVSTVDALAAVTAAVVVPTADIPYITVEIDLPEKIIAPVYQGQKIGEIVFYNQEKAIKQVDIVAAATVDENTLTRRFFEYLISVFHTLSIWGVF